jgi:hypothetical protein
MKQSPALLLSAAIAFLCAATPAAAAPDFPAKGWFIAGSDPQDFDFGTERVAGAPGKSAYIKSKTGSPSGFGTLMQTIAADNYRGQRLKLSALVKTQDAARAQLWMRMDGPDGKMVGFYNMDDRAVTGTTDWKRYGLVLDVPPTTVDIAFGYFLNGKGEAWATDFKLEPVGKDTPVSTFPNQPMPKAPVNMDFAQ